jgi:hypothetical protein
VEGCAITAELLLTTYCVVEPLRLYFIPVTVACGGVPSRRRKDDDDETLPLALCLVAQHLDADVGGHSMVGVPSGLLTAGFLSMLMFPWCRLYQHL